MEGGIDVEFAIDPPISTSSPPSSTSSPSSPSLDRASSLLLVSSPPLLRRRRPTRRSAQPRPLLALEERVDEGDGEFVACPLAAVVIMIRSCRFVSIVDARPAVSVDNTAFFWSRFLFV